MKRYPVVVAMLFAFAAGARAQAPPASAVPTQVPAAVPTKDEPHHHLVLENAYVRVLHVEIPAHGATLLHAHDLPYVSVTLGAADFVNAVTGKPEAHATLADAQVGYSKGGFSHIVRTDAGQPFANFTVELLKAQGAAKNRCVKVVADSPVESCPPAAADANTPVFETEEMLVESGTLAAGGKRAEAASQSPWLFLVLEKSELTITIPGLGDKTLHTGDAFWLPAGAAPALANPGAGVARFLVLTFK
ncbi:MAG: hypothetical protein ACRD59_13355 [Candidatus Acidiferrales bacterium]